MKEIHVTVCSGLCNRMFVIAAGLLLREKHGHKLSVFWTERTGRHGLPYVGNINSGWDQYFERLAGVSTYGVTGHVVFQDSPVALDKIAAEQSTTPVVAAGTPAGEKYATLYRLSAEAAQYFRRPKIVDPAADLIIVRGETHPFGTPADSMERHSGYYVQVGPHRKDEYWSGLARAAKLLTPVAKLRALVDAAHAKFAKFDKVWGVHVRGTDLLPRTRVDRKAAILKIIAGAPAGTGFYVASDAPVAWLPAEAGEKILSYDNPVKYENSVAGTQHAIVDLYVLARCDRLFGSAGSSFSEMAWLLSDLDVYTVHS